MSLKGNASANVLLKGTINRLDKVLVDAYAVAVRNGFEGTEEEWLESLEGKDCDISSIVIQYAVSDRKDRPPDNWLDEIPEMTGSQPYLWMKVTKTYTYGATDADVGVIGCYNAEHNDDCVKTVNGIAPDENGNVVVSGGSGGLSDTEKKLMLTLFKNAGYADDSMLDTYNELATLWGGETIEPEEPDEPVAPDEPDEPEKTLTSISATYSGGDVAVGTAVTALTGIVVTAHYSDGTSEIVTGYTLSGTIAEGSNTVTVSYSGKTTTFSVTGIAESGGDDTAGTDWEDGVAYADLGWTDGYYINGAGNPAGFSGYSVTDFIPCAGASTIDFTRAGNPNNMNYTAFYSSNQGMISGSAFSILTNTTTNVTVPEGAAFFRITEYTDDKGNVVIVPYA